MVKPCKRLGDPGTWGRKVRIKTGEQLAPRPLHHLPAQHWPFPSSLHYQVPVITLHLPGALSLLSLVLFSFSPRPRMLQPSLPLPGHPPLLPCLPCSVQGLRQTVPKSFFLSLSFLHLGRAPCSGHRPQSGSAKLGIGDHSMGAWKMQECRNMNPTEAEKVFRFPRTRARKQDPEPSHAVPARSCHSLLAMQDLE